MGYYIDTENNIKLKREGEKAWLKTNKKEQEIDPKSDAVVDIMLLNQPISKEEYEDRHLDGSINHNVEDMMDGVLPDLPKDSEIILYCRSGGRAEVAREILQNAGFSNVKNGGGIDDLV